MHHISYTWHVDRAYGRSWIIRYLFVCSQHSISTNLAQQPATGNICWMMVIRCDRMVPPPINVVNPQTAAGVFRVGFSAILLWFAGACFWKGLAWFQLVSSWFVCSLSFFVHFFLIAMLRTELNHSVVIPAGGVAAEILRPTDLSAPFSETGPVVSGLVSGGPIVCPLIKSLLIPLLRLSSRFYRTQIVSSIKLLTMSDSWCFRNHVFSNLKRLWSRLHCWEEFHDYVVLNSIPVFWWHLAGSYNHVNHNMHSDLCVRYCSNNVFWGVVEGGEAKPLASYREFAIIVVNVRCVVTSSHVAILLYLPDNIHNQREKENSLWTRALDKKQLLMFLCFDDEICLECLEPGNFPEDF